MASQKRRCINAKCNGAELIPVEIESSLSLLRFDCPKCGRPYTCPTKLAKAAQVATVASALSIAATFAINILTGDLDVSFDDISDPFHSLFS